MASINNSNGIFRKMNDFANNHVSQMIIIVKLSISLFGFSVYGIILSGLLPMLSDELYNLFDQTLSTTFITIGFSFCSLNLIAIIYEIVRTNSYITLEIKNKNIVHYVVSNIILCIAQLGLMILSIYYIIETHIKYYTHGNNIYNLFIAIMLLSFICLLATIGFIYQQIKRKMKILEIENRNNHLNNEYLSI